MYRKASDSHIPAAFIGTINDLYTKLAETRLRGGLENREVGDLSVIIIIHQLGYILFNCLDSRDHMGVLIICHIGPILRSIIISILASCDCSITLQNCKYL